MVICVIVPRNIQRKFLTGFLTGLYGQSHRCDRVRVGRSGLGVYGSVHISHTKVYGPMLLALRGYDGCPISRRKNYVTFEWPQMYNTHRDQTLTALYIRGQFSVGRAFETTPSSCCILLGTCSSAIALCRGIVVCLAPSSSGLGASEGLHRQRQVKLVITVYS